MLDYRPDLDPRTPGILTALSNMVPTAKGYEVSYAASAHTAHTYSLAAGEAYPNKLFASRWLSTPGGIVLCASNIRLSVYDYTNGFINVSKAGDYALGTPSFTYGEDSVAAFDLCAFGDIIIACNKAVVPQKRSALDLTIGTLFADLTGAPKANTCCVASNFVFLGNCDTWSTVTGSTDILAWSAIGDYTDWTVNAAVTQCSYAQFNDTPGAITAVRRFRDGVVVFKADAMYYGRYVGAGTNSPIWDFTRISDRIGCVGHRSVRDIDSALIFVGRDDVYSFDGTRPVSITDGVYSKIGPNLNSSGNYAMQVGHDKPSGCVWLGGGGDSHTYVWNYRYNRWGRINNSARQAYCETNAGDFRTKTISTVTAGVQAFTTSTNHSGLYTLTLSNGAPKNFNSTRATSPSLTTGLVGDPIKLQTLERVQLISASGPSTPTNTTVIVDKYKNPATADATLATVSMNAQFRFDMLAVAGGTGNFFNATINPSPAQACEIMDIGMVFTKVGAR